MRLKVKRMWVEHDTESDLDLLIIEVVYTTFFTENREHRFYAVPVKQMGLRAREWVPTNEPL